ncbi:MAG TPA: PQQ-binding-like beta-propeller repeat protein [Streptosporangiaceae bacterium]
MIGAYAAFAVAMACFGCAVREKHFPFAKEQAREHRLSASHGQAEQAWEAGNAVPDKPAEAGAGAGQPDGPAFTGRWRYAVGDLEDSPRADIDSAAMPGSTEVLGQPPFVRVGVWVACDPLLAETSDSQTGAKFVAFLSSAPVAGFVSALTGDGETMTWTPLPGGDGLRLEAMLGDGGKDGRPCGLAVLAPPAPGLRTGGRGDGIACLWLQVGPRAQAGSAQLAAGLAQWHERLVWAVSVGTGFAEFLAREMGLRARPGPATRVGVMLQAPDSIAEMLDAGNRCVLPGASQPSLFLGYAIADPAGKPAREVADAMLAQLCDRTMHRNGFPSAFAPPGRLLRAGSSIFRRGYGIRRRPMIIAAGVGILVIGLLLAVDLPSGPSRVPGSSDETPRAPAWTYETAGPVHCNPLVVGGTVYVGSDDHTVYALNAANSHLRWRYTTRGQVQSRPAVARGTVYVGSDDHAVYALNAANGHLRWRFKTEGSVVSSPAVARGTVYVGSRDDKVYALNAANGDVRWVRRTSYYIVSSPAVAGHTVYIGSGDNKLYALNTANGRIRWAHQTGAFIFSSPVVAGGTVYVGSSDDKVYALNAANGDVRWAHLTRGWVWSSPVVVGGIVYVGSKDGKLYALNAANGHLRWAQATGWVETAPSVANGTVYAGSRDGKVYALNTVSGRVRWTYATEGAVESSPAVANGTIYFGSDNSKVYAVNTAGP